MRNRVHGEKPGQCSVESTISILQPRHFILCDEVLPLLFVGIETYTENHERLAGKPLRNALHVRERFTARTTPCRPEIEQDDLTLQFVHRNELSVLVSQR